MNYNSTFYLFIVSYYIFGDYMRTFYIYNVNDYFCSVYDKYPYKLYKMLEDAYLSNRYNKKNTSLIYEQIITNYNKLFINNYIFANNKFDIYYYNKDNIHLISNRCEYTKMVVTLYCIKLKSNINYPKFFDNICNYSDNIFICDFVNKDYFWLNKIAKNKEIFVK